MRKMIGPAAVVALLLASGLAHAGPDGDFEDICCVCVCDMENRTGAVTSGAPGGQICVEVDEPTQCSSACIQAAGCSTANIATSSCSEVQGCASASVPTMAPTLSLAGLSVLCAMLAGLGVRRVRRRNAG